ncbi:MAG: prepilin-type N-terminal cleavage/methylation domain-containing protein [Methylococcaceae bacterium]|nr:prepilin-type N-terminal cleavage/methylation domain-containing protein [Methylococcaceae bacterium]
MNLVPNNQRGFSLLEILIAFSIMALSLGILLKIFSGGVNTAQVSENYTVAIQIAESLMSQAGVAAPLQAGETSGVEQDKYEWLLRVTPHNLSFGNFTGAKLDAAQLPVTLFKVSVIVSWGDDNRRLELTKLKLAATE